MNSFSEREIMRLESELANLRAKAETAKDLETENKLLQTKAKTLDACLVELQKAQQRIAELEAKAAPFDKEVESG